MPTLRELLDSPQIQRVAALMRERAQDNPSAMLAQTDMLRGAREGQADPALAQALPSVQEQALADRYAWGADIANNSLVGPLALAPAVAYEGVKAVAPGALSYIGNFLPQGEEMAVGANTSPASVENIKALLAGYLSRR